MNKNTVAPMLTESEFNNTDTFSTKQVAGLFGYSNVRIWQMTRPDFGPFVVETLSEQRDTYRTRVRIPKAEIPKLAAYFEAESLRFKRDRKAARAAALAKKAAAAEAKAAAAAAKSASRKKRDHKAERAARKARAAAALAAAPVEAPVVEQADPAVESAS